MPAGNVTIRVSNLSHEKETIPRKRNNATTCGVGNIIPSSIQDPSIFMFAVKQRKSPRKITEIYLTDLSNDLSRTPSIGSKKT